VKFTIVRLSLATVLLAAVGVSMQPHLTSYVSTSALVNAPLVSVSAPFNGVIEAESASVTNAIYKGAELQDLQAELSAISGEISGVTKQVADLDRLSSELIARRDAKVAARREWFSPRLDEARWEIAKAEAKLAQDKEVHERTSDLAQRGAVSALDAIRSQAELRASLAELERRQAVYRRLEVEKDTLSGERGIDMSAGDFGQIEYRIDEISIRRADLDARLLGLQTRQAGLKTQISRVSLESVRQEKFSPTSATTGVIWNASPKNGSNVAGGEGMVEILDCSRRFLEVVLPERHFESVKAGTRAWVKLKGASKPFTAKVVASYGSGARPNRSMQAASPRIEVEDGVRVIVGIDDADISSDTVRRSFCDVGRAAEVRFHMDGGGVFKAASSVAGWFGGAAALIWAESQGPLRGQKG
jgi:multidrug resistance efflux pump